MLLNFVLKTVFLKRLREDSATGVGAAVLRSLSDDVDSLCLVKECRELETNYGTNFTDAACASGPVVDANNISQRVNKKTICEIDRENLVQKCSR